MSGPRPGAAGELSHGEYALVQLGPNLTEGRFLERLNRFAALMKVAGQPQLVHIANSGRMRELLAPGHRVLLQPVAGAPHRKTRYDLALVDLGGTLVSADSRLPNALVREALEQGRLPQFAGYPQLRAEVVFGESRLDLRLDGPSGTCYIETKSVTLVNDGVALFPDAPTVRGVKHLGSLSQAVAAGHRAAVMFVVQRSDAQAFAPNDVADPAFGAALRRTAALGVEVLAHRCQVTERQIVLAEALEIRL
ncbi:MAG: DNA/RNA nuclease SfsA [Dehalococcoidia bacterium]|nr:DNA/RNA nuclease SfsA [Dehalococcoidia bacterium]